MESTQTVASQKDQCKSTQSVLVCHATKQDCLLMKLPSLYHFFENRDSTVKILGNIAIFGIFFDDACTVSRKRVAYLAVPWLASSQKIE